MFIPTTNAVAIYQLDQPVSELNGHTLREIFENRNMAMPDYANATPLSGFNYRFYNANGITIDYNITNGQYEINGTQTDDITVNIAQINTENGTKYTLSYIYISGSGLFTTNWISPNQNINDAVSIHDNTVTLISQGQTTLRFYFFQIGKIFDNFTFKLQLEKGSIATPYKVPKSGPYSDIDIGQFGLTTNQFQTYYDLYLEAVRFESENVEARQDTGGYQNIFKSIINGVKNLMQEMGSVWNFLNAPILTDNLNFQLPNIDWSWDIISIVRQVVDSAGVIALQTIFIVPNLIYTTFGIPMHVSILSLLFSNLIFLLLGWIIIKSFII